MLDNLSKEGLENLYSFAYTFYEKGKYEKALHFFRVLTTFDATQSKHWKGLGAAYQMLKQYPEAIEAYATGTLITSEDASLHMYAGECFWALGDSKQAFEALEVAESIAKNNKNQAKLLSELALIREGWCNKGS